MSFGSRRVLCRPFFLTTPVFYVNSSPHVGHLHSSVLADSLSRWHQMSSSSGSFLVTGTDEHGLKVATAAQNQHKDTQLFCDHVSKTFKDMLGMFDVGYDRFIRTTEKEHERAVTMLWNRMKNNGWIYKGKHEGWYDVREETFVSETRRNQLDEQERQKLIWVQEENYMFRLSAFAGKLLQWIDDNPEVIQPRTHMEFVRKSIQDGLEDISVSRIKERVQWGITVPDDPKHLIYVWFDALANYLTASGFPDDMERHRLLWPPDLHIIGKDILKFHGIYWPAFLMAADLPLPKAILSHSHWTVGGTKMSKSLGNVVDPVQLVERIHPDCLRYYLMRDGGIQEDGVFSYKMLSERINSELSNTLGNLVSRTCALLPTDCKYPMPGTEMQKTDFNDLISGLNALQNSVSSEWNLKRPNAAIWKIIEVLHTSNQFFQSREPWKLKKATSTEAMNELEAILYISCESIRIASILLWPIMPSKCTQILDHLGVPVSERSLKFARVGSANLETYCIRREKVNLFPRIHLADG